MELRGQKISRQKYVAPVEMDRIFLNKPDTVYPVPSSPH